MTLNQKIAVTSPKKILTLDGGGIRGMITVEILGKIEALLREKYNNDQYVLANYFDYISGTSTGAIIATCLSLGWSVEKVRQFYIKSGEQMFDKASIFKRYKYSYEDKELRKLLQQEFGKNTTLGSSKLKTLLMMVMRNASTNSPWPVSNNPRAKYNDKKRDDCNLKLPLWQLVRASTAAPTFFPPEKITLGDKEKYPFVFVDGGITMYNNPSFQTFLMSTLGPYKLGWDTGVDKILIISLGTGTCPKADKDLVPSDMNLIYNAKSLPAALMSAALHEQDILCRSFGKCVYGEEIDNELGNLQDQSVSFPIQSKLFTYARYNAELSRKGLDEFKLKKIKPEDVQMLDSVEHIGELQQVGQAIANNVTLKHFAGFL